MSKYNEVDVAVMLNLVAEQGLTQSKLPAHALKSLGWDKKRAEIALMAMASHMTLFGNEVKPSGKQIMQRHPEAAAIARGEIPSEPVPENDPLTSPIRDRESRRQVLNAMLQMGEKYRRPFETGTFAAFSVVGTTDWQDYAATVLKMAELETMLNIEEKLDDILEELRSQRD